MKASRLITTLLFATGLAAANAGQPHMKDAAELLRDARTAPKPIAALEAARKQLDEASHNKRGERVKALEEVKEAIEAARAGDKEKMVAKIDHALMDVHAGEAKAR